MKPFLHTIGLCALLILLFACTGEKPGSAGEDQNLSRKEIAEKKDKPGRKMQPVYLSPFDVRYPGGGHFTLVDGKYGSPDYMDGKWQGYQTNGLDVAIDLGSVQRVKAVSANFLKNHEGWMFLPQSVSVYASDNLKSFHLLGQVNIPLPAAMEEPSIEMITLDKLDVLTRYVRVSAATIGTVPDWHTAGKGKKAWLFVDEIVIERESP
jgi:hypothetical protein